MTMSRLLWLAGCAALALVACADEVVTAFGGEAPDGVDPDCYEGCLAKGESPEDCAEWCDKSSSGGKGTSSSGKPGTGGTGGSSSGSGGTSTSTSGTAGAGGKLDPEVEKPCIECWYDEIETGGACDAEAAKCDANLACTQLQWCPVLCGKPQCIPECNEIIPSGVEDLAALVQCAACDGGPCADECAGSAMLYYCQ